MEAYPLVVTVFNIFEVKVGGRFTVTELIKLGGYEHVYGKMRWRELIIKKRPSQVVKFWSFAVNRDVFSKEIIFSIENNWPYLQKPDFDDCLFFGKQFPWEFHIKPKVFLHEPIIQSHLKFPHYLVLSGSCLSVSQAIEKNLWSKDCKFFFIEK